MELRWYVVVLMSAAVVLVLAAPVVVALLWQINDRLRALVQLRLLDEDDERVSGRG